MTPACPWETTGDGWQACPPSGERIAAVDVADGCRYSVSGSTKRQTPNAAITTNVAKVSKVPVKRPTE